MSIGIIGAGNIGAALARAFARSGVRAVIANRSGPESLKGLTDELSPWITAATPQEAAKSDIVVVAVNWSKIPGALEGLGPWDGKIVVDANNPIESPLFRPFDLGGRASSEVVADMVPGARVVKAFNHLVPGLLGGDPQSEGGRRVLFFAGDDAGANAEIGRLIDKLGFAGIDLGRLAEGGRLSQFPGGPLPTLNLVRFG